MKFYTSLFMRPSSQQKFVESVAGHQVLAVNNQQLIASINSNHRQIDIVDKHAIGERKLGVVPNWLTRRTTTVKHTTENTSQVLVTTKANETTKIDKNNRQNPKMAKLTTQSMPDHDDNHEVEEAWQSHRRWLGTIFLIWFFLAFALLLNAIYY